MNFHHKVTELLSLIYSFEESFRSVPDQASRQLAAAGLMRCCALLKGVHTLEDNKLGVISGILERAHWETWLVSIHVLFRGEEALLEIAGDDIHWKRTLSRELDLGYTYHEDWEGKLSKLNYKTLADGVKPLLIAAGESDDPDGRKGYNFTFRVQSLFAVHAGLSTFSSFLQYGKELWGVVAHPPSPFPIPAPIPALHTAHLARYVFQAFGLPSADVERVGDELLAGAAELAKQRIGI